MSLDDEPSYSSFCYRQFGPAAYQGRSSYLRWLYQDNPFTRGLEDCLIATASSDEVVGCIHRMRIPWDTSAGSLVIPTLHNLMVDEAFRGGAGFFLLKAAVTGESHAFIPGVEGDLATAYVRMKYQRIHSRWYRRVVRPERAAWQALGARLGRPEPTRQLPPDLSATMRGFAVTTMPDDDAITAIAGALNGQATISGTNVAHVAWSGPLVRWRFFSLRGPRHVLVQDPAAGSFAIVSVGPRHGVTVARLLAWSPIDAHGAFLGRLNRLASDLGAAVLLTYDARPDDADSLAVGGWQPRRTAPMSFLFARDRQPLTVDLDGGVTDLGFEAIPYDRA